VVTQTTTAYACTDECSEVCYSEAAVGNSDYHDLPSCFENCSEECDESSGDDVETAS